MIDASRYAVRLKGRFAPGRQWSKRELKEMRALYIDKRISAATTARLFKTTTTQVYRLARIHDWPHRRGGPLPNPLAVRRLGWKHAEIYRHLLPTIGHDAALAEAWRGKSSRVERRENAQP